MRPSSGATSHGRRAIVAGALATLAVPYVARALEPVALGLTPVFVDSDLVLLNAIERELSRRTGAPVTLVKRRTYQEILAMLLAGQVTAAWICGFPFRPFPAAALAACSARLQGTATLPSLFHCPRRRVRNLAA